MSLQHTLQPKSSSNGFGRRRNEKEGGARLENKPQSGKSNSSRSSNSLGVSKVGVIDGPSRDRLVYVATCLIGHSVEVQLKNGSIYSGTCYTTNVDNEFAIILKMARLTKDVFSRGQKQEFVSKAPSKTFVIPGKEVVQVIAKDVSLTMDGISSEIQCEKQQEIMIDSYISQSRHVEAGRELEPWVPDENDPQCPELENTFDGPRNRDWDQFKANAMLFGVRSTYDEELYTTKLERGPKMREVEREAARIAREIEGEPTQDLHLAEERGIHLHEKFDFDEETRFSSVNRGGRVDDSGYDEIEDILLDSLNSETFGSTSASSTMNSADFAHGRNDGGARPLSSSSLDEAQCSQSTSGADLHHSGSPDHGRGLVSELPYKESSNVENRIQEKLPGEQAGNDNIKEPLEEQRLLEDNLQSKYEDAHSLLTGEKGSSDKGSILSSATALTPSHVSSKGHEKTSTEQLENVASVKGTAETQLVNSRGRPGSSTSSNSDCVGAPPTSSGPGLSPSSSVGSLSSEKSTLNPHAKEFKLNPHAKSFTPSQLAVRPPSPVSDGHLYFAPNVSGLPHMPGSMPMGIGIGPTFPGHQPLMFNAQVAPLQSPQAYFHPGGPQYGQHMLLGHPRPLVYMPGYQPDMPYKGRDF